MLLLLLELLLAGGGDGGGGVAKAMSAAPKETKRRGREDEGDRSKRKRHREERQAELQAVQAAGEEQARKALQEIELVGIFTHLENSVFFNQMISYLYELGDQLLNFLAPKNRIY